MEKHAAEVEYFLEMYPCDDDAKGYLRFLTVAEQKLVISSLSEERGTSRGE